MIPRPYPIGREERARRQAAWNPAPLLHDSDDWRLTNSRDLAGVTLHWATWTAPGDDWDHDHCAGCSARFTDLDLPDALREGWTTDDDWPWGAGAEWVCDACFRDLRPILGWRAAGEDGTPRP